MQRKRVNEETAIPLIPLKPIHWDILELVRVVCYEGLPQTKLAYVGPSDNRLPQWKPNQFDMKYALPTGVPEPLIRSCILAVPWAEATKRWDKDFCSPDLQIAYLTDRKLLNVVRHDNNPFVAAFKNLFNQAEILFTIRLDENVNGKFYVWHSRSVQSLIRDHQGIRTTISVYPVYKLDNSAIAMLDARKPPAPVQAKKSGRPSLESRDEQDRLDLVYRWKKAKEAGVSQADFCNDNKVTIRYLAKCVNWAGQRERRKKCP